MRFLIIFPALLALSSAERGSPNADLVLEYMKTEEAITRGYTESVLLDALLDVPRLISKYNYPSETHEVMTEDGYFLEMHRIPHGRDNNNVYTPEKPVVLIQHGLLSASSEFVTQGPGYALAYILAEEGYDVWLGNARGNYYSRRHTLMNPDGKDKSFWRFSWDEIGFYDLPAMVEHITRVTGQQKMHYIGHSQGGTAFVVLNSLRPEYNDRFISFQGLAPATFFDNNANVLFNFLSPHEQLIQGVLFGLGFAEVGRSSNVYTFLGLLMCNDYSLVQPLCGYLTAKDDGFDHLNKTMIPVYLGHAPAGASINQIAHYGQSIRSNSFARYDYGIMNNIRTYGTVQPPAYPLEKITVPSYLHYGVADVFVDYRDIYILAERLGNCKGTFQIPRASFTHTDFIWHTDARDILYPIVIQKMKEAEQL